MSHKFLNFLGKTKLEKYGKISQIDEPHHQQGKSRCFLPL